LRHSINYGSRERWQAAWTGVTFDATTTFLIAEAYQVRAKHARTSLLEISTNKQ